jgi:hypothetical protein
MTRTGWDDERLLREAVTAASAPDVPDSITRSARAVYTWRTIDAELAEIAFDSARAAAFGADVRGDQATLRTLTFESRDVVIELELSSGALVGQLVPGRRFRIEMTTFDAPSSGVEVDVDQGGYFAVRPAPAGPFKLAVQTSEGRRVVTPWVSP